MPCRYCPGQQLALGFVFSPVRVTGKRGHKTAALISRSDAFAALLNLEGAELIAQTSKSVFLAANGSCSPGVTP